MYDGQLEMSFASGRNCHTSARRQRRVARAQWWFQRMRQVVDRATDWQPSPPARPEQIWFAGAHRLPAVSSPPMTKSGKPEQQEVCE